MQKIIIWLPIANATNPNINTMYAHGGYLVESIQRASSAERTAAIKNSMEEGIKGKYYAIDYDPNPKATSTTGE